MDLRAYAAIARPDNWFKNIFVLPGAVLAFFFRPDLASATSALRLTGALACTCLVASSYYVLNELLDARFDIHHPVKKHRPIPSGRIHRPAAWVLFAVLAAAGIAGGFAVNTPVGLLLLVLWMLGLLYNVPPVRLKDRIYLDVLSESLNNPARLALGWYAAGLLDAPPPLSIVVAYWMFGAFLMAVKRLAEYRRIGEPVLAAAYRKSFGVYTEGRLLVSSLFYAVLFGMMAGVFISRYRLELILSLPVIGYALAYYLHMGMKPDSPAQYPEKLYRQRKLVIIVSLAFVAAFALLFFDLPFVHDTFTPRILPAELVTSAMPTP